MEALLTASDDKTARLWRVKSGEEITKPMQHERPVWAADNGAFREWVREEDDKANNAHH